MLLMMMMMIMIIMGAVSMIMLIETARRPSLGIRGVC
jgi:hypothetical protein